MQISLPSRMTVVDVSDFRDLQANSLRRQLEFQIIPLCQENQGAGISENGPYCLAGTPV